MLEGVTLNRRWRLDRRIGGDGGRDVFQATDLQTPRDVVVEVFPLAADASREQAAVHARFRDKTAAAAGLRHPNLAVVHEVGTHAPLGLDFVVTDLLHGEDLLHRLRRKGPLGWQQVSRILHDAAQGLGAAHRAGLVHGAVRPATLFLERDAGGRPLRARVLSLGTAALEAAGGAADAYAAPEQRRGGAGLTPAVDAWGLGITAFELLTGTLPFTGAQADALARGSRIRSAAPSSLNPGVPPAADALIARALSADPEERPTDGEAFAREMDAIRRDTHLADHPAPAPEAVERAAVGNSVGTAAAGSPTEPEAVTAPPPTRRNRGVRAMVLSTAAAAAVAVFSIALAGRSLESEQEYLAGAQPIHVSRKPTESEIDHTKKVFHRIDVLGHTIREWRMELDRLRRFEWRSADSAHATVYEDRNGIQKIRVRTYEGGVRTLSLIFYYDYSGELVFVFEIRPSGGGRRAEQRFYFSDRALILWRDTRNEVVPLGPGYEEFAVRLHRISDRLIKLAHARR